MDKLKPSEKLYCDVLFLSRDTTSEFPKNLDARAAGVLQKLENPFREVLRCYYYKGIIPNNANVYTTFTGDEFRNILHYAINYIRNSSELKLMLTEQQTFDIASIIGTISITALAITGSLLDVLVSYNIKTIGDLMKFKEEDLISLTKISSYQADMIKNSMADYGVTFATSYTNELEDMNILAEMSDATISQKVVALCKNDQDYDIYTEMSNEEGIRIYKAFEELLEPNEFSVLSDRFIGYSIPELATKYSMPEYNIEVLLISIQNKLRKPESVRYILTGKKYKSTSVELTDPIENLGMSNATTNLLKRYGYNTVESVSNLTVADLAGFGNLGPSRCNEIISAIRGKLVKK